MHTFWLILKEERFLQGWVRVPHRGARQQFFNMTGQHLSNTEQNERNAWKHFNLRRLKEEQERRRRRRLIAECSQTKADDVSFVSGAEVGLVSLAFSGFSALHAWILQSQSTWRSMMGQCGLYPLLFIFFPILDCKCFRAFVTLFAVKDI